MGLHVKKVFTILVVTQLFLVMILFSFGNVAVSEEALPTIKVVDPSNGSSSISLGSPTDDMPTGGYNFTVSVVLDGLAPSLFLYQIGLRFNLANLRCTAAWIPKTDPSFVFDGKQIVEGLSQIDNVDLGYVFLGASLLNKSKAVDVSQGLFVNANFTAVKTGSLTIDVIPTTADVNDPYYGKDTFMQRIDQYKNQFDIPFNPQNLAVTVSAKASPPVASFDVIPANPKANETVTFDASGSFDPDGNIVSYYWDFGDASNDTTAAFNITHVFTQNGLFSVNLTITDNDGLNSSIAHEVSIGGIPFAMFSYDWERKEEFPLYPYMNINVTFNATLSVDPDTRTPELPSGNITLYVWNFTRFEFHSTDTVVSYSAVDIVNETTTNATLDHFFAQNGIYNVLLTIFNKEGLSNSTTQDIFVGTPPVTNFTIDPQQAMPDDAVLFNAYGAAGELTYDPDGFVVYSLWDFGDYPDPTYTVAYNVSDVSKSSDLVTTHTYVGQGGVYYVNLTVFDNDGLFTSVQNPENVTIVVRQMQTGSGWQGYAAAGAIFGIIVAAAVWYRRRPEKEPSQRDRYRVI